jgi:hypothetical protein
MPAKPVEDFTPGFKSEWIDFKNGIRIGHLEPEQRITQILKAELLRLYQEDFLVDHWGRGVYWAYIWFCPRKNLKIKNFKGKGQFPSAKYFIGLDSDRQKFVTGFYVESGYSVHEEPRFQRQPDWDWNRFIEKLKSDSDFEKELRLLIQKEGFELAIGFEEDLCIFSGSNYSGPEPIIQEIEKRLRDNWVVVQIYFPFTEKDIKAMDGSEIVQAVLGTWQETSGMMNMFLQIPLIISKKDPVSSMKTRFA